MPISARRYAFLDAAACVAKVTLDSGDLVRLNGLTYPSVMEPHDPGPTGDITSVLRIWSDENARPFGLPVELNVPSIGFGHWGTQYDVSPDGRRIYFLSQNKQEAPREFNVIMGWRSLLK